MNYLLVRSCHMRSGPLSAIWKGAPAKVWHTSAQDLDDSWSTNSIQVSKLHCVYIKKRCNQYDYVHGQGKLCSIILRRFLSMLLITKLILPCEWMHAICLLLNRIVYLICTATHYLPTGRMMVVAMLRYMMKAAICWAWHNKCKWTQLRFLSRLGFQK